MDRASSLTSRAVMATFICQTCGVQYAERSSPPAHCAICDDERQYVGADGQRWTTLPELRLTHENAIVEVEPDLFRVGTIPDFAIGQHAFLVRTGEGNVLWDCISLIDEATERAIRELGGVAAIAISHPHFYGSCVEWSRSFDDAPIFLPEADRSHVMRPDPAIRYYDRSPGISIPGVGVTRVGGHFAGSSILHWVGADGRGVVLSGDSIAVGADRSSATFMYSYPNGIPLSAQDVRDLASQATIPAFDRLYSAWPGDVISTDARAAVLRSAERYVGMLEGTWPRRS
jgi:hypothetical protein